MNLRQFLSARAVGRHMFRRYVSTINVNVKSLSAIKVKAQDYLEASNDEVKFKFLDEQLMEVDVDKVKSLAVQSSRKAFQVDCQDTNKLSMIIELPLESTPEIQLNITALDASVHVANLQIQSVNITLESGDVSFKNLKSDSIRAETEHGNVSTTGLLLGKVIQLMAKNGVS
jgi:DUF4097 and DUF4098 domain-containing protein YvlB